MLETAERKWQELGERHGYTGALAGIAEVLRQRGIETTWRELTDLYHDPLVELDGPMRSGTATFDLVARMLDVTRGDRPPARLPHPFDKISTGGSFPYPTDSLRSRRPDLSQVEAELAGHLKKEKIRTGTKRYRELAQEKAGKVEEIALAQAQAARDRMQADFEKAVSELDKLHDQALAGAARSARRAEIRRAVLDVAGMSGSPTSNQLNDDYALLWESTVKAIEEHAAYLESQLAGFKPEEEAATAIAASQVLGPFVAATR